jgi:branched-subunit amino acid ABC-type transport system permease component
MHSSLWDTPWFTASSADHPAHGEVVMIGTMVAFSVSFFRRFRHAPAYLGIGMVVSVVVCMVLGWRWNALLTLCAMHPS